MDAFENPSDDIIRDILATPKTIAVVGCSPDPDRDSNRIAALLKAKGHRIIPVNPTNKEILGEHCYTSVREIPEKVDMVDVFRRPEFVDTIADDAIAVGAKILWLQLDVINEFAAQKAQKAGMTVVMDRCPAIEYRRLF
ncbi:MAG: CoA-binding protein [Candidatus Binatia bacterium]